MIKFIGPELIILIDFYSRASMIENLKIIKAHLENEQTVTNQVTKNVKKNVSASKQINSKQKNKTKVVSNSESGL